LPNVGDDEYQKTDYQFYRLYLQQV
jgi:hypothetical protein